MRRPAQTAEESKSFAAKQRGSSRGAPGTLILYTELQSLVVGARAGRAAHAAAQLSNPNRPALHAPALTHPEVSVTPQPRIISRRRTGRQRSGSENACRCTCGRCPDAAATPAPAQRLHPARLAARRMATAPVAAAAQPLRRRRCHLAAAAVLLAALLPDYAPAKIGRTCSR